MPREGGVADSSLQNIEFTFLQKIGKEKKKVLFSRSFLINGKSCAVRWTVFFDGQITAAVQLTVNRSTKKEKAPFDPTLLWVTDQLEGVTKNMPRAMSFSSRVYFLFDHNVLFYGLAISVLQLLFRCVG